MPEKKYFGTDGIRGKVGQWPITADFMLKLGRAAGKVLTDADGKATVVIGKDTRISGYMFESALEAGLLAAGADVRLLGPMPTPAVAWLTQHLNATAGIVISASHNPYYDNGIKFFSAKGEKLDDAIELAIEQELDAPFSTVSSEHIGKAMRIDDAPFHYTRFCKSTLPAGFTLNGLKLVVDCAHGANYQIAPRLFAELGAEVIALGNRPNGLNINENCGSTKLSLLAQTVVERQANLGIAFDGDGDRLMMVDHTGRIVDGDELVYILANDGFQHGKIRGPIVGTLMSNFGLERSIKELGLPFLRAKVGDRYVMQMLKDHNGVLGGETSGHILNLQCSTTGDGLINALHILEIIQRTEKSLVELGSSLKKIPQTTVNIPTTGGKALMTHLTVKSALEKVEQELNGLGRVVLRPSGTEPIVRITVEAEDSLLVERLVGQLSEAVKLAAA